MTLVSAVHDAAGPADRAGHAECRPRSACPPKLARVMRLKSMSLYEKVLTVTVRSPYVGGPSGRRAMRAVSRIGGAKWSFTSLVLTVGASNLVGAVIVTG